MRQNFRRDKMKKEEARRKKQEEKRNKRLQKRDASPVANPELTTLDPSASLDQQTS